MVKKKHFIGLLLFVSFIFIIISVQTVNADKSILIDEGLANYKNSNITKLNWEVYSSDKQLKIYSKQLKRNSLGYNKKILIKKVKNNKLKISILYSYKGNVINKNYTFKSKLNHTSYYYKIYKPKMVKNLIKTETFEKGKEPYYNGPHGEIKWKAHIYHGKKVIINDRSNNLYGHINKTTLIEKHGKNRLKITTKVGVAAFSKILYSDGYLNSLNISDYKNRNPFKNKNVTYVKTKLSPKDYYIKTHKWKLFQHIPKKYIVERAYGLLKNSNTKLYWNAWKERDNDFIWNRIVIYRGFSFKSYNEDNNDIYDKITIEISNINELKITHQINKTKEIKHVNTKLAPLDYYLKVYREKMIEILDKPIIRLFLIE